MSDMTVLDYLKKLYMQNQGDSGFSMPPQDASLYGDRAPMFPVAQPQPMQPTQFQPQQAPGALSPIAPVAMPGASPMAPVDAPTQKPGFFDFLHNPGMRQALLSAGAQFLEGGGSSPTPISTGQGIGRALNSGMNAYTGYNDREFEKAYKTAALGAKGDAKDNWRDLTPDERKKYFPDGIVSGFGAQINTKDGQIRTYGVDPFRVTQTIGPDGLPQNSVTDLRNPNGSGSTLRPAPPGYRYLDPKDPSKGLTPIKGGSADILTPQQAGQVSMIQSAQSDLAKAGGLLLGPDGKVNRKTLLEASVPGGGFPGSQGRNINSYIRNTLSTILRLETGAAATPSEVDEVAKRYQPSLLDSDATIQDKLQRLQERLRSSMQMVDPTDRLKQPAVTPPNLQSMSNDELLKALGVSGG